MKKTCLFFFSFLLITAMKAQDFSAYKKYWLVVGADTLPYRVLLPEMYDTAKKYPLILFLHGRGERGNDNQKQLINGGQLFLQQENRLRFPAFVVFPQCPPDNYWSNVVRTSDSAGKTIFHFQENGEPTTAMKLLQHLLDFLPQQFSVEESRMYVGGLSMGGMGTFELVRRNPQVFAAAFAICGGAHPATAEKIKETKWWIFHGARDDVVPPKHSERMVDALKKEGPSVRFTLYPNANHNSWDAAFAEKDLLPWLFSHKK